MQDSIVFFDGLCNLCNGFVDWLIKHDSRGVFKVASLQGSTAKAVLPPAQLECLDSVALFAGGEIHTRSTAVLKIAAQLGGVWCWAKVLLFIPRPLRDWTYRLVAKNRYALFGKRDSCRLPTPDEKARFLP